MDGRHLSRIYGLIAKHLGDGDEIYLVQSVELQKLFVCRRNSVVEEFDASTSRFGVGIREDSYKTPPGMHRIVKKIGAGGPVGRIFKGREDTGANWDGQSTDSNLILTRILRLAGLEQGVNKGVGVDSHARFIYIHGTNQEEYVGTPVSHGCIVMRNQDIVRLFDEVREGTVIYIQPLPLKICDTRCAGIHFTGIFGTGMSALAQYLRFCGLSVSGSDRLLGESDAEEMRRLLEELGCKIVNQDGSGIRKNIDVVCVSTAIEESNPEMAEARKNNIPVVHRSDILAAIVSSKNTIAVAGTSGKSTVTAMIFEFLTACGKSPSLISGAPLRRLEDQGLIGNAYSGASDLLVVEADESDGTIVKYAPDVTVVLNVSKDHHSVNEILELFKILLSHSGWTLVNGDDPLVAALTADCTFGRCAPASWYPDREELLPTSVKLFRNGFEYHLSCPGEHSLENLRAALCVCEHFGCSEEEVIKSAETFKGVDRRFTVLRTKEGVYVVDDFAHNPAKIAAAVQAARGLSERIIAVYQPHGYGPTRFLREEYISTFRSVFKKGDALILLPIYYAGGTAVKDIASADIVHDMAPVPFFSEAAVDRGHLLALLKENASQGSCILLMGARDPSLPSLALRICELFGGLESGHR